MALIEYLGSKEAFFSLYGSFWRLMIQDRGTVQELAQATSLLLAQLEQKVNESELLASHQTSQSFRMRLWRPLVFRESELDSEANVVSFGSGRVFGDGLLFGQKKNESVSFAIPTDVKDIGYMVEDLAAPELVLTPGVDFVLDTRKARLVFKANPFDDPRIPKRDLFNGGKKADREITVWAISVAEHDRSVYLRHGAVIGLRDDGEASYAEAVALAYQTLLQGPSAAVLRRALHAIGGLRVAEGGETVLEINTTAQDQLLIITDRNVYRFHVESTPLVAVGDTLEKDQVLADTVVVEPLGSGNPDLSTIPALVLNEELASVAGPIGIANEEVAITQVTYKGVLDIEFPVFGRPEAVQAFWRDLHQRGIDAGRTLRDVVLEWKGTLQTTINPVELIAGHLIANNAVVISLKPEHFLVRDQMGAKLTDAISRFLPPRMLLLQYMFLTPTTDTYTPGGSADEVALYGSTDTIDSAGAGISDLSPVVRSYPVR